MKTFILTLALTLCLTGTGLAFSSVNELMPFSKFERMMYFSGVFDGWETESRWDEIVEQRAKEDTFARRRDRIVDCVKSRNMTQGQLGAIMEKYIAYHPEKWDHPPVTVFYVALNDVCNL